MAWTTYVSNFLYEYRFFVFFAIIIIIYFGYRSYKKYQSKSKTIDEEPVPKPPPELLNGQVIQPQPIQRPPNPPDFNKMFNSVAEELPSEAKDMVKEIDSITKTMDEDSMNLDKSMADEHDMIRKQLQEVQDKKARIQKYGLHLSHLFEKYKQREVYLKAMLAGMNDIIQNQERYNEEVSRTRPDGPRQ